MVQEKNNKTKKPQTESPIPDMKYVKCIKAVLNSLLFIVLVVLVTSPVMLIVNVVF